MRYTLMREEREIMEFDINLATGEVGDAQPLEDASLMPLGVFGHWDRPEYALTQFIHDRCISPNRPDLPAVLEATGARSTIELAFRSNGFSLSDPYWYRAHDGATSWEHGNFFDNDWDPSFGDAVMRKDYDALGKASPVTPDVTCSGASRKAWLRDAEGPLLLKAPVIEGCESTVGEALTSRMVARMLPRREFVSYELVERDGQTYSACRTMVGPGEELTLAWQALSEVEDARGSEEHAGTLLGLEMLEELRLALARLNVEGWQQVVPKVSVIAHLAFNRDMHPYNLGVIRARSGALRLAPFFDFDRTFSLSQPDRIELACKSPLATQLMMARSFSGLDPSWDYSWYDQRALDGFEDEIERTIGACETVPDSFAELAAELFVAQRTYVSRIAGA